SGRTRTCELQPQRLRQAERWLAEQRAMWEARSDRMVEFVERLHQQEQADDPKRRR
ncbi:transcriptional regulator, partial [Bacillus sp. AFS075960]